VHKKENSSNFKTFRDPGGSLMNLNGRLIRVVNKSCAADLRAFLASSTAQTLLSEGCLVHTKVVDEREVKALLNNTANQKFLDGAEIEMVVEHQKIFFASFPYEWPPEMLLEAGCLTLNLAEKFLSEKICLKDATPYNVLFSGSRAVFVDLLSIEKRNPLDPVWLPCAQFERTFVLPLLLNKHRSLSLKTIFTAYRDGVEPETAYQLCGPVQRFLPVFMTTVTIPTWLGALQKKGSPGIYKNRLINNPEKARFILGSLLKRLCKTLRAVTPKRNKKSTWQDYMSFQSYSKDEFDAKDDFVKQALSEFSPKKVLDAGCNTGHFSALAAECGAKVVAIDSDPSVVGEAWHRAASGKLNILPLVVDITRPSPATGWRNLEYPSFLDRAAGAFDAMLMLAIVHHMLVSERIPLSEIVDLASELTTDLLVIEFVAPNDPMFRTIARGRDDLFSSLTQELFERVCCERFNIVRSQQLSKTRRIYLMRKKS